MNYCRDHSTSFETKLWNVDENYKIENIHHNTSIHWGGSMNSRSRFPMVVD